MPNHLAGAGGRLAAQATARAGARDNLLILANPAVMVIAPLVFQDVGYDVARDFALVSMVSDYSFAVAVPGTSSLTAMADLTATLRAGTTAFQVGVPATGSLPHFFALSLAERLGTPAQVIGYKGSGPLLVDLIGGHLPIAIDTFDALATQHAAGKVRLLATSGDRREALAPDVPTRPRNRGSRMERAVRAIRHAGTNHSPARARNPRRHGVARTAQDCSGIRPQSDLGNT